MIEVLLLATAVGGILAVLGRKIRYYEPVFLPWPHSRLLRDLAVGARVVYRTSLAYGELIETFLRRFGR